MRQSFRFSVHSMAAIQGCGAILFAFACEPMERPASSVDCSAETSVEYFDPVTAAAFDSARKAAAGAGQVTIETFAFAWEVEAAIDKPADPEVPGSEPVLGKPAIENNFYCFADPTVDGYPATAPWPSTAGCTLPRVKNIDGGGFCQEGAAAGTRHQTALHIQAGNHVFWGGTFGTWHWNARGVQATFPSTVNADAAPLPADGLAFWARREVDSDAFIGIYLSDENTTASGGKCTAEQDTGEQPGATGTAAAVDPNLQTNNSGIAVIKEPSACGNRWRADLELAEEWQFIKLPFSAFYSESVQPNRSVTEFNPELIYSIQIVFNRGQTISMWFDEVGLYREK